MVILCKKKKKIFVKYLINFLVDEIMVVVFIFIFIFNIEI